MNIDKRGFMMPLGFEALMHQDPKRRRKGHVEKVELTAEDRAAHARARAALEELEHSAWVYHGYEPDELKPLQPRNTWVYDETEEEFRARLAAMG